VGGLASLFAARLVLGIGEGATFPTATRAMAVWTPEGNWGFAQGITHSFARIGNAATPPLIALLVALSSWRVSFVVLAVAGHARGSHLVLAALQPRLSRPRRPVSRYG
jgi:MFS family permease